MSKKIINDVTEALDFYLNTIFKNSSEDKKERITNKFARLLVSDHKKALKKEKEIDPFGIYASNFFINFGNPNIKFDYNIFFDYMFELNDQYSIVYFFEQIMRRLEIFCDNNDRKIVIDRLNRIANLEEIAKIYFEEVFNCSKYPFSEMVYEEFKKSFPEISTRIFQNDDNHALVKVKKINRRDIPRSATIITRN